LRQAELGRGRLAGDHDARGPQRADHVVVLVCDVVPEHRGPERHTDARDHVQVLDGDRDPGQRRQFGVRAAPALRRGLLGLHGLLASQVLRHRVERPDLLAEAVYAVQVVIGDLDRRQLALADRGGELDHGHVMNLRHATEE